jgi:hypothetical protein
MRILNLAFAISALGLAQRQDQEASLPENQRGKTVMLFTPHPDDDTFCCAGTLYKLARTATGSTS